MTVWLLLLGVLGLFTYLLLKRYVTSLTRTPVWLLWLMLMMPALVWTVWIAAYGSASTMPLVVILGPLAVFLLLYWVLLLRGRVPRPMPAEPSTTPAPEVVPEVSIKPALRPINREEEATLKNCFPWTVYYLQAVEYRPQVMICRGQLRTSSEMAYQTVEENIRKQFGDRFLVMFREGGNGKPFFALVPNPNLRSASRPQQVVNRPVLALLLLLITLMTTTLAGAQFFVLSTDTRTWMSGLPYGLALMTILGVHELAHYLTAVRHKIRTTLPYFIPIPPWDLLPFGTFGAFIQMRSPMPNRKALFDVAIAGPLAGFIVTLPPLLWGLAHSVPTGISEDSSILNFKSFDPKSSFLLALLSRLALGDQLTAESALQLHPVAVAGCLGVVVTALNLMPVGQLDGGHIVHAMFGQRTGMLVGQVAKLLLLLLSLVRRELFVWAVLLFFIPAIDEAALNDVSELDNRRDFWGLLSLVLLVFILLPAPRVVTQLLFSGT